MLKKICRFLIIALIQVVIVGALAVWLIPYLLNDTSLQRSLSYFLRESKIYAGAIRVGLYGLIFIAWPKVVQFFARKGSGVSEEQIQQALKARWLLMGCFLLLDVLYWLR